MRRWLIIVLTASALGAFGLLIATAAAPKMAQRPSAPAPVAQPKPESGELRTYRTLQRRISFQMQDEPLSVVLKEISARGGFNCLVDPRALQEIGVSPDAKVRVAATDKRLSTLLDQILDPLGLDFVVNNETVKITNRERAKGDLLAATYPIRDLVMRVQNGKMASDAEAVRDIIDTITSTISPESWAEREGPGSVTFSEKNVSLAVRQTTDVQREIQALLSRLRRERTAPAAGRSALPVRSKVVEPADGSQDQMP